MDLAHYIIELKKSLTQIKENKNNVEAVMEVIQSLPKILLEKIPGLQEAINNKNIEEIINILTRYILVLDKKNEVKRDDNTQEQTTSYHR
ncbi:MAG: hypothetical protein LBI28_03545 [Treponema sp.]|jgi:hypothetical protein|nr:hypothetical protein [Treponema sp.]